MRNKGFTNGSIGAWWIYLLVGLLAVIGYFLLSTATSRNVVYGLIGAASVVAVVAGIRLNRPERPLPWWLLAAGLSLLTAANLVWTLHEAVGGSSLTLALMASVSYLAGYPVIATGLMLLSWKRSGGWTSFVDPAIIATGAGMLSWVFLMDPYARDSSLSLFERLFLVSYPFMDLLLLAAVVRLLMVSNQRPPAYLLLALGAVCSLLADTSQTPTILAGTYTSGDLLSAGWLLRYVLFGAAALHPSMAASFEAAREHEVGITWWRFALLGAALFTIPGTLVAQAALGEPASVPVVFVGSAALFALVLTRIAGIMRVREETLRMERILRRFGEALMASPDREGIYHASLEAALDLAKAVPETGASLAAGSTEQMTVVATSGHHPQALKGLRLLVEDLPQPIQKDFVDGKPVELRNVKPALFWKVLGDMVFDGTFQHRQDAAMDSLLLVPLYVRGELGGVISLSGDAPFPAHVIEGLKALSINVSLALESTVLSDESHQRRSEARFGALVRHASGVIMILDESGTIRYASPSCKPILNYEPEDLTDTKALQLVHPKDRLQVRTHFAGIPDKPGVRMMLGFRMRHADGSWRHVESVANNLLDDPDVRGVVINCRDITERKSSEEALKEAELRYRTLVEQIPAVTYTNPLDETGHSVYISPRVEDMLGFTVEEGKEDPGLWDRALHPEDRERVIAEEVRTSATGEPFRMEYRMISRNGLVVWVRDESILVRNDEGRPQFWQGIILDITERKDLEQRLAHQAFHDELTRLPNRALFMDRLKHAMARTERREGSLAVLFIDLDEFKLVNDSFGHEVGDSLLADAAHRIKDCIRPEDTAARLGGDEFTILLEELTGAEDAVRVAGRVRDQLHAPFFMEGHEIHVTASIGIAFSAPGHERPSDLLRDADTALYRAKTGGKAGHAIFDENMKLQAE